jgi:hypothetical protein
MVLEDPAIYRDVRQECQQCLTEIGIVIEDLIGKKKALEDITRLKLMAEDLPHLIAALENLEQALNTNSRNRVDMPVIGALSDITFGFGEDSLVDSLKKLKKEQRGYKKNRRNS